MTDQTTTTPDVQEEQLDAEGKNTLFGMARNIMMAGVGAVALAQEEVEAFVNKLIERGEVAEKEGKKFLEDLTQRRKEQVEKTEDEMSNRIEEALGRMSVPTKSDIKALSAKISTLTKKVDELAKSQQKG